MKFNTDQEKLAKQKVWLENLKSFLKTIDWKYDVKGAGLGKQFNPRADMVEQYVVISSFVQDNGTYTTCVFSSDKYGTECIVKYNPQYKAIILNLETMEKEEFVKEYMAGTNNKKVGEE